MEGCKGLLVLALGTGLLATAHRNVEAVAEWLVARAHLNPASRFPHIFIEAAARTHDSRLTLLAAGAFLYAAVRLAEGYGLWRDRSWAEVLAAGSGAIYLPFEVLALVRHANWAEALLLLVNVAVVALMLWSLWRRRFNASGATR